MRKKYIAFFLALLLIIYNTLPVLSIKANTMPTNSQYEQIGAFALASLIQSGEATELDFSDTTVSGSDFLVDLGKGLFTGDFSDLAADGLSWLGNTANNVVQSIQDSVHEIIYNLSPELFNFWYSDIVGQNFEIIPNDATHHLGQDLRKLFTPQDNIPTPQPDVNYANYINTCNSYAVYCFNFYNFTSSNCANWYGNIASSRSFITSSFSDSGSFWTNMYETRPLYAIDPLAVYITGEGNSYSVTYSHSLVPTTINSFNTNYKRVGIYVNDATLGNRIAGNSTSTTIDSNYYNMNSLPLQTIFQRLSYNFRNIAIYVNGVMWADPFLHTPTYPIEIPGTLTIWQDQPLNYEFPVGTYIDLTDLTTIIKNAINNSDIVHWSDIKDTYVDINGQTAVAVTNIYRNDDDNLYIEQYPLITLPKFDKNELDVLSDYVEPVNIVIENTVDILPDDIVNLLKVAIILVLFSCIIHRLLE